MVLSRVEGEEDGNEVWRVMVRAKERIARWRVGRYFGWEGLVLFEKSGSKLCCQVVRRDLWCEREVEMTGSGEMHEGEGERDGLSNVLRSLGERLRSSGSMWEVSLERLKSDIDDLAGRDDAKKWRIRRVMMLRLCLASSMVENISGIEDSKSSPSGLRIW